MIGTQNLAKKNQNGIFGISVSRGFRKSSVAMCLVKKKIDHFQCSKKISGPEFIITDQWSCQLSPFPNPPIWGGSIDPCPPVHPCPMPKREREANRAVPPSGSLSQWDHSITSPPQGRAALHAPKSPSPPSTLGTSLSVSHCQGAGPSNTHAPKGKHRGSGPSGSSASMQPLCPSMGSCGAVWCTTSGARRPVAPRPKCPPMVSR